MESIANLPPASSERLYEITLLVASASIAFALIPTSVPFAAFSLTEPS